MIFPNTVSEAMTDTQSHPEPNPSSTREVAAVLVSFAALLIWARYERGGRPATSSLGVKLLEVVALARGRRDAMAIAIACQPRYAVAAADMQTLLDANAADRGGSPFRSDGP